VIVGGVGGTPTMKLAGLSRLLSAVPPGVVTVTSPVVAVPPTVATIWVAEFVPMAAATPPMVTDEALLRLEPLMVTCVPTGPLIGEKLLIEGGGGRTVNQLALLPVPPAVVTLMVPVVAPFGTVAVIWMSLSTVKLSAAVPLNFTCVAPVRAAPLMTTLAPTTPDTGLEPLIVGGTVTVKAPGLVPVPAAVVTETLPVVTPLGTVAVIELSVQLVIALAAVPLNDTVFEP
jgi:hypothetical protein